MCVCVHARVCMCACMHVFVCVCVMKLSFLLTDWEEAHQSKEIEVKGMDTVQHLQSHSWDRLGDNGAFIALLNN